MTSPQFPGEFTFGSSLLDKSRANPGNIDMSIFQAKPKPKPVDQGSVSSDYLQRTRADNPEPGADAEAAPKVVLSHCKFATPVADLKLNEEFEFSVEVKKLGEPRSMAATFDLYATRQRDGKQERDKIWSGKKGDPIDAKADPVVLKGRDVLATQADYALGELVTFELEAMHPEAERPAKSEKVDVSLKTVAHWVGGDDLFFGTDGEFPLLGEDGSLVGVLVAAAERFKKPGQDSETVICFGFASSAGDENHNRKLSLRRAKVVKALLDRDEAAWVELAKANFETRDIQQFLSDLHAACGWECDPGAVDGQAGPKTKAAIESFQNECNARYGVGLKPDGVCGPKTWGAVHRVILGQVQAAQNEDATKDPVWPKPKWGNKGKGVHANGEDYATGGDKPEERSVQITFFAPGSEPPLKEVSDGQKPSPEHNPVQQPDRIEKKKVTSRSGKPGKSVPSPPESAYRYPFPSSLSSLPNVKMVVRPHRVEQPFRDAWGQIIAVDGEPTNPLSQYVEGNDPPTFAAKVNKVNGRFVLQDISWTLGVVFRVLSESSSSWTKEWSAKQSELTNEPPGCTLVQRKQRAFAHENDHYKCYEAYWRFINHYIDEYSRKTFETADEAGKAKFLLKRNIEINFTATRLRSSNFDLIPLEGGKYGDPSLRKDLDLRWYPTTEEVSSGEGRVDIIRHEIDTVRWNLFANQEDRNGVVYDPISNGRSR